jgi:hypothetical protein
MSTGVRQLLLSFLMLYPRYVSFLLATLRGLYRRKMVQFFRILDDTDGLVLLAPQMP